MKLTILLISFIFIGAHATRVKRGLSADEQKKFLDELNKDRKRVADEEGFTFVPMEYDVSLEKKIVPGKKCFEDKNLLPLQYNDVAEQLRKQLMRPGIGGGSEGDIYQLYFHPNLEKIGCSKEAKCTHVLKKSDDIPQELDGKTVEYHGLCAHGKSDSKANSKKLTKAKIPSPNKTSIWVLIPCLTIGSAMMASKFPKSIISSSKYQKL
ncbi:unnamed protein product [Caenorhabditis brenneri]